MTRVRPRRRPRPGQSATADETSTLTRSEIEVRAGVDAATRDRIDDEIDRSISTGDPVEPVVADDNYEAITQGPADIARARVEAMSDQFQRKEYRLRFLHRMLIRQLPMDLIAQSLDVSVRHVFRMREELYGQLRKEAQSRDLPSFVGYTDGFYNEIIGMAMRMATAKGTTDLRKLGAMKVAMQAQRDRIDFYERSGFFSAMKLTPMAGTDDDRSKEADALIEMSQSLLNVFNMSEEEYEAHEDDDELDGRDVFAKRHGREPRDDDEDSPVRVLG